MQGKKIWKKKSTEHRLKKSRDAVLPQSGRQNNSSIEKLARTLDSATIFGYLLHKQFYEKAGNMLKEITLKVPTVFSMIDNPKETVSFFRKIVYYGHSNIVRRLNFDHTDCKQLDLCASTIMDVILMGLLDFRRSKRGPRTTNVIIGGTVPLTGPVREILDVSGAIRHFTKRDVNYDHIRSTALSIDEDHDIVATNVVQYFRECLKTQGYNLTDDGRKRLSKLITETVENAINHGGDYKHWYSIGHYHLLQDEQYGLCQLVLFNFGDSIYHGLKHRSTAIETINELNEITERHQKVSFFSTLFKQRLAEECLWTVFAMQEGVSRCFDKSKYPDRGNGTMELIDGFIEIGSTIDGKNGRMSLVSGAAYLLFDGTFRPEYPDNDSKKRKIIAFNRDNNLMMPPSQSHVYSLSNSFPGTVISMKFYLDNRYLEKIGENYENRFRRFHEKTSS